MDFIKCGVFVLYKGGDFAAEEHQHLEISEFAIPTSLKRIFFLGEERKLFMILPICYGWRF